MEEEDSNQEGGGATRRRGCVCEAVRGFRCGKEEGRREVGRENAVCVRTERRCTHEVHELPFPKPNITASYHARIRECRHGTRAGVESPAKSSPGNLLKISSRPYGYRVFSAKAAGIDPIVPS